VIVKRLVGAAALVLFAALVVWIAANTSWVDTDVPMPPRGEAARNPFYAAQRFTEALGATTQWDGALRLPRADGVLVASNWTWALTAERREQVETWVEAGGRLVVDQTLLDGAGAFEEWTGIGRIYPDADAGVGDDPEVEPAGVSASGCRALVEDGTDPDLDARRRYTLCGLNGSSLYSDDLPAWQLGDDAGVYALRVSIGRGSVTVIDSTPFGNSQLFEADHGAVLVASTQLRGGDEIHFLFEEDQASLLTLIWRHGAPVVELSVVLLALALSRGAVRFGPLAAPPELARRSLAEQIRGTGRFVLRFGGGGALRSAVARALREAASRRISAFARSPSAERIASIARATGLDATALASAHHERGAAGANELASSIALLETARRRLQTAGKGTKSGN
jgi:hypothetical protein